MGAPLPVEFVLVRPARAVNIAAACRALKNMGFARLRVVGGLPTHDAPGARATAYGAWDVWDGIAVFPELAAALEGCHAAVATTGKASDPGGPEVRSPRWLAGFAARQPPGTRLAVVFGPEQRGLSQAELDLCQERVRIPTDEAHSSLNLAQAVLLIAYELFLRGPTVAPADERPWAERAELERTLDHWRDALVAIEHSPAGVPPRLLAELRRLLARAKPSSRELRLLRGIARQAAWAGRVARARRDVR